MKSEATKRNRGYARWATCLNFLWCCMGLGSDGVAQEPWHVAYEKGLSAVRRGDWSSAETKLKQALQDGPPQDRNVRLYGLTFIDFIPSLYLAKVYFNQSRYMEAQGELSRVQSLALVKEGDAEFSEMNQLIEKLAEVTRQAPPGPEEPTTRAPPAVSGKDTATALSERRQEATALVNRALRLLADGDLEGTRKAFESARSMDPDNPDLEDLDERIARLEGQVRAAVSQSQNAEIEGLIAEANRLWLAGRYPEIKKIGERSRSLGLTSPQLDELIDRADFAEELAELSRLVRVEEWDLARHKASQLATRNAGSAELRHLRRAIEAHFAGTPTESLRAGIQAFYSGKYQAAAVLLENESRSRGHTAQTLFYLACSQVALALWEGSDDKQRLLTEARNRFDASRRMDPEFRYDRTWISPRILRELTDRR